MKEEEVQKLKDNISEYGNDEYYESKDKKDSGTTFKPMSCFEN